MAVDETVTLTEPIITRIGGILKRIDNHDHMRFGCCPNAPTRSTEYLVHFFKRHFDNSSAPREYLEPTELILRDHEADEYRRIKAEVREAGDSRFVQDKYWNTRHVMDFCMTGSNMVILHDYSGVQEQAQGLREYFSRRDNGACAAELRFALNHGSDQLQEDRTAFLRDVYLQPGALAVVGRDYPIEEAERLYDSLFGSALLTYAALDKAYGAQRFAMHMAGKPIDDTARVFAALYERPEAFKRLEQSHGTLEAIAFTNSHHPIEEAWDIYEKAINPIAAFMLSYGGYGKEAALQYLAKQYPSHTAAAIIDAALPEEDRWDATELAFKNRILYFPTERYETSANGISPAPEPETAAYK